VPEGIVAGLVAGVVGGLLGGLIGRAMAEPGTVPESAPRWLAPVVAVGVLACLAYPFPTDAALDGTATLALEEVDGRAGYVRAEVTVEPSDLADDAEWFNVTAWQGGGSVVQELLPSGDGRFRAPQPIPVQGDWKALIRYQHDRTTLAAPIYLPRDEAIPAPEVPAEVGATREFIADKEIVLREARDVDETLTYSASAVLVLIAILWALALSWGLARLSGTTRGRATSARAVHAS
jgi:hypothetical protein